MLIDFRERKREGEKGKETSVWEKHLSIASHVNANQVLNLPPRNKPWLEIEPIAFLFIGWLSNQLSNTNQGHAIYSSICGLIQ